MEGIRGYLERTKPVVDAAIKRYVPERMSEPELERLFGKARYRYDAKAAQRALAEPIWDFLGRGGKRWRPAIFLLVAEAFGLRGCEDFCIVPELAHEGSIVIDDVEDAGEVRRGKPALHKVFGVDVAVNAGNFLYFVPLLAFLRHEGKVAPERLLRAYRVYAEEMTAIHYGQATDIAWHKGWGLPDEERYLQMCALKTGTLARLAARLAVALAGGSAKQEEAIGRFAESLGIAFQIRDDVLSASPEHARFAKGKGYGDDVTEGKRSLVVLHALERAMPEERKRLLEILGSGTRERAVIDEAFSIFRRNGAQQSAMEVAERLVREAWEAADAALPEGRAKGLLRELAEFAMKRDI